MNNELKSRILVAATTGDFPRILAIATHQLTVCARVAYRPREPADEAKLDRLRIINELIHQISSKLRAQIDGTPVEKQYPDDIFLQILVETAGQTYAKDLDWAFESALKATSTKQKASSDG